MNRLTREDINKVCYDCWELCELDDVCNRDCFKPTPCKIPSMISKLAKYEDTGVEPEELQEALEKQTPKKINSDNGFGGRCPVCGYYIVKSIFSSKGHKYCPECGQKLDWEVNE